MAQALYSPSFFFKLAVIVSVGAHAIVLAVRFVPPALDEWRKNQDIEVILVNARTDSKPLTADKLAQVDLDGGGNTDRKATLESPLPNLEEGTRNQQLEDAQQRVEEREQQQQKLLTSVHKTSPVTVGEQNTPVLQQVPVVAGEEDVERIREMQALLAKIGKQTSEYQSRPRRAFVGARAKSAPQAAYIESVRVRIDRVGTQNFPAEIARRKLYGKVMLEIQINKDGTLHDVKIIKPSPHPLLDDAALRVIRQASPFQAFPKSLSATTDILVLTRYLTFTRENLVESIGGDTD